MMVALSLSANAALPTQLVGVSTTELPAQAAKLVVGTKADEREAIVRTIITSAMATKPTIAPALVGAIAKSSPELAPIAAVTAATLDSKQIGQIVKSAVLAAQPQAGKIVQAVCAQYPNQYNWIAMAAYEAAPKASEQILAAEVAAVPALKLSFGAAASVPEAISASQKNLAPAALVPLAPGPIITGPSTPAVGTPVQNTPTSTVVVPPGTPRNYSL